MEVLFLHCHKLDFPMHSLACVVQLELAYVFLCCCNNYLLCLRSPKSAIYHGAKEAPAQGSGSSCTGSPDFKGPSVLSYHCKPCQQEISQELQPGDHWDPSFFWPFRSVHHHCRVYEVCLIKVHLVMAESVGDWSWNPGHANHLLYYWAMACNDML